MIPILEHCDSEGMPAYLESSKESNIAFYRRHGFKVDRRDSATWRTAGVAHVAARRLTRPSPGTAPRA